MSAPLRVLVPVSGSSASFEAVAIGCQFAAREKGEVEVVHVIEVSRALPVDADLDVDSRRGELVLRKAEELATENGCTARGELLQARLAADAILEEARTRQVGLIVLGLEARSELGSFALGSTVTAILESAACAVWLIRKAAPQ